MWRAVRTTDVPAFRRRWHDAGSLGLCWSPPVLDRITRRAHTLSQLLEDGYSVRAADMPGADDLMMRVYAAMAQKERELISERTRAALAAAKRRGTTLGGDRGYRPKAAPDAAAAAIARRENAGRTAHRLMLGRCRPSERRDQHVGRVGKGADGTRRADAKVRRDLDPYDGCRGCWLGWKAMTHDRLAVQANDSYAPHLGRSVNLLDIPETDMTASVIQVKSDASGMRQDAGGVVLTACLSDRLLPGEETWMGQQRVARTGCKRRSLAGPRSWWSGSVRPTTFQGRLSLSSRSPPSVRASDSHCACRGTPRNSYRSCCAPASPNRAGDGPPSRARG